MPRFSLIGETAGLWSMQCVLLLVTNNPVQPATWSDCRRPNRFPHLSEEGELDNPVDEKQNHGKGRGTSSESIAIHPQLWDK